MVWQKAVRGLALLLGVGTVGMVVFMFAIGPDQPLPGGFSSPLIAVELARDAEQVQQILTIIGTELAPEPAAAQVLIDARLRQALSFDQAVVVPLYMSVFILLAWCLSPPRDTAAFLGFAGVLGAALATGLWDTLENTHTLYMLDHVLSGVLTDADVGRVRQAALAKWAALGAACLCMAGVLWRTGARRVPWVWAIGGVLLVVGLISHPLLIRLGMLGMGLALCGTRLAHADAQR